MPGTELKIYIHPLLLFSQGKCEDCRHSIYEKNEVSEKLSLAAVNLFT